MNVGIPEYELFLGQQQNDQKKGPQLIFLWTTSLLIFLIILLIIAICFTYPVTRTYTGVVTDIKQEQVTIYATEEELYDIRHSQLYKEKEFVSHQIVSISNSYLIEGGKKYLTVVLKIPLTTEEAILNNILNLKIVVRKTTLMKEFLLKRKWYIEKT